VGASLEGASVAMEGLEAPPLDTLAQPDQSRVREDKGKLIKRARAKYITVPLAASLAELRSPLERSYRNTVYCAGTLVQEVGKLKGKYCGNRWCLVCNRVRIARSINRYLPVISRWENPHLVTLTLPNVRASELSDTINNMLRSIITIGRAIRRTDRIPLRALRKLECTYNPQRDDYHPHIHLAVDGRAQAEALRLRWLQLHPESVTEAQDVRRCDCASLKELFKYFTKLIVKRPNTGSTPMVAPVVGLDVIFCAMKCRRVYQPMGFRVGVAPTQDENGEVGNSGDTAAPTRISDSILWEWLQEMHDWVDLSTGDLLTGYEPTVPFRDLVARTRGRLE